MTPAQCRAARALVDISQEDLAREAGVGLSTVRNFEKGRSIPIANNLASMIDALQKRGIAFLADGQPTVGSGVSLKT